VGIVFQTLMAIISRAFFALHDTKTPVLISMMGLILLVTGDIIMIAILHMPVWALAASFSFSTVFEAFMLMYLIHRRVGKIINMNSLVRIFKIALASFASGFAMFFFLKFFDRYTWIQRISFLNTIEIAKKIPFQKFVLDTRYTVNVLALTIAVAIIGFLVYFVSLLILRSEEIGILLGQLKGVLAKRGIAAVSKAEQETVIPTPTDNP